MDPDRISAKEITLGTRHRFFRFRAMGSASLRDDNRALLTAVDVAHARTVSACDYWREVKPRTAIIRTNRDGSNPDCPKRQDEVAQRLLAAADRLKAGLQI